MTSAVPAVRAADRGHLDDLPVDQLDPVLGGKDAGVGHPVVGADVEATASRDVAAVGGGLHGPRSPMHRESVPDRVGAGQARRDR